MFAEFQAAGSQNLHAYANAEERLSRLNNFVFQHVAWQPLINSPHRGAKRANAGKYEVARVFYRRGIVRNDDVFTNRF